MVATYRRGDELVTEEFVVPVLPAQQAMYLAALEFVSEDLTVRLPFPEEPILDT
ncbi:MAG: hypothetical protein M3Q10_03205 [Chloroflexota bacterium]|nr:hypothetical protein [Chloroflexota bacterium]